MTHYDEQLRELKQQVIRRAHLKVIRDELYAQKRNLENSMIKLQVAMECEKEDVERLEGRSLSNFFYELIGKREEKLDKERKEAYAAAVKYDTAVQELEAVKEKLRSSDAEYSSLSGCDRSYAEVLEEKKKALKSSGTQQAEQLLQLEDRLLELDGQMRELNEAIAEGQRARQAAQAVLEQLNSAEGWGTWDLIGGGLISDIAKHNALDRAQNLVKNLQFQLRRFKTELADVEVNGDIQVTVEGFLHFADFFFDGLFADWAVLDHIHESQSQVAKTNDHINTVMNKLTSMLYQVEAEQKKIKVQMEEIVNNTAM